jgi:hypothetical protein
MNAISFGSGLALRRVARIESAIGVLVALAAVVMVTLIERRASSLLAADRALGGIALGIALPLVAYGWVARACAGKRLDTGLDELARHGANRRLSALGALVVLAVGASVIGALFAALAVFVARVPADPRLASDLFTSSWIGALAGIAYVCWFGLGSTFGPNGGGRMWLLVLDWMLGAGASAITLPWPRAHIQNLLGAEAPLGMPQWAALVVLVVLSFLYLALAVVRSPK